MSEAGDAPRRERERMVAAFVELAAERGYEDVAAAVVERRAGLPGAFDRHFDDLVDCALAAWDQLEREYLLRLAAACADVPEWRDRFRLATAETMRLIEAYPRQAKFMAVEVLGFGGQLAERRRGFVLRLTQFVDDARSELDDPQRVPPATAGWIVGTLFDRVYRRFTGEDGLDLAAQLPELRFLAVSAFFGTEAGLEELRGPT